jgi:Family of unknown function (DUF6769)
VIKNKNIILPFLLLAWTIIFSHSIVPHHHHFELSSIEKDHCHHDQHEGHDHESDFSLTAEFDCCDHNESGHACHFHVEILTQVSIDNIFIASKEKTLYSNISCVKTNHFSFYQDNISEEFPKTNYLRGPPSIA